VGIVKPPDGAGHNELRQISPNDLARYYGL